MSIAFIKNPFLSVIVSLETEFSLWIKGVVVDLICLAGAYLLKVLRLKGCDRAHVLGTINRDSACFTSVALHC